MGNAMKILKKAGIASWLLGCVFTVLTGSMGCFAGGLFIGIMLFSLDETLNHFFISPK